LQALDLVSRSTMIGAEIKTSRAVKDRVQASKEDARTSACRTGASLNNMSACSKADSATIGNSAVPITLNRNIGLGRSAAATAEIAFLT